MTSIGQPLQPSGSWRTTRTHGHVVVGTHQVCHGADLLTRTYYYMLALRFVQQASRNTVRVLRGWKHAVIFLRHEFNASVLKPLISSTIVKLLEEPLQQPMPSRIYLGEVGNVGKRVGAVATTSARDFHFGQQALTAFQDGHFHLGHHFLQVHGQKESCSSTANNRRPHHFLIICTSPPRPSLIMLDGV